MRARGRVLDASATRAPHARRDAPANTKKYPLGLAPLADGSGMSQDDFMQKDECIVLNYNDEVLGPDNKYNVHKFLSGQPKGILHRAFSVMLFDADGRLLLQQRAASKITFPKVWTNTCCSHPLFGQLVNEVAFIVNAVCLLHGDGIMQNLVCSEADFNRCCCS